MILVTGARLALVLLLVLLTLLAFIMPIFQPFHAEKNNT